MSVCVICNARFNTVFYWHARSHPRSSYTEKAKPSLNIKALLKTISDLTQGIWVGFAAFYNRGETIFSKYFEKLERQESTQQCFTHLYRISSPTITGMQVVGAHATMSNYRDKTRDLM